MTPPRREREPSIAIMSALRAVKAGQVVAPEMAAELRSLGWIQIQPQSNRLHALTRAGERRLEGKQHAAR